MIFCHPSGDSFQASILAALTDRLGRAGHRPLVIDLYGRSFDPVLGAGAWRAHREGRRYEADDLAEHVAALQQAEALVLVYPTWWYGLPAMLKGWFDRVWQPGVAFTIQGGVFRTHQLPRLRRFAVITTCGSPRAFIEWVVGDPARRQLVRGLALQMAQDLKTCWAAIYDVDSQPRERLARSRDRAVARVVALLARR